MKDQAVYITHPNVVAIVDGQTFLDAAGNEVIVDQALVDAEFLKMQPAIKLEEVRRKRSVEYPPVTDMSDALVKLASSDPLLKAAGQKQLDAYNAACLAVKAKYPKP